MLISFKKFVSEEHTDTFTHENNDYSLTKLKSLAASLEVNPLPVSELIWIFEYDDPEEDHPERIVTADLKQPILVTKDQGQLVVLDGLHRLAKAQKKGVTELPSKMIPADMLKKCLIGPSS